jgi:hypothetical protein
MGGVTEMRADALGSGSAIWMLYGSRAVQLICGWQDDTVVAGRPGMRRSVCCADVVRFAVWGA